MKKTKKNKKEIKDNKEKIINIVRIVVAGLLTALFIICVVLGILAGAKTDKVSNLPVSVLGVASDSMYPKIKAGDGIIEVNTKFSDLKVGDIITIYQNGELVTHQIVARDDYTVTTKGIANDFEDAPISAESYAGKVLIILPGFATFLGLTAGWRKVIWILVIVFVLFGPEVIFKISESKRNKKGQQIEKNS